MSNPIYHDRGDQKLGKIGYGSGIGTKLTRFFCAASEGFVEGSRIGEHITDEFAFFGFFVEAGDADELGTLEENLQF